MSPGAILISALAILLWLLFAAACQALQRRSPRADIPGQLVWIALVAYVHLMHRVRYQGLELIPRTRPIPGAPNGWRNAPGPLIIVANHTAGIDPMLLHRACPFDIRWMMMRAMMPPSLNWFWDWLGIIAVGPTGQDAQAARIAIRHLKDGSGGVIGVFPEGGIERPVRHILPFEPGVGLLVSRSKARVLLAVIDGTPDSKNAYLSLFTPSRSRVRFIALIDYTQSPLGAAEIAADLRERTRAALGWPLTASPSAATDPGVKQA